MRFLRFMEAAIKISSPALHFSDPRRMITESVEKALLVAEAALQWHRANFVFHDPTPQEKKDLQVALKWIIPGLRFQESLLEDPEVGDPALARQLGAMRRRLQEAWQYTFNPISADAADQIIHQHFPG
jgi:hypothetical protein